MKRNIIFLILVLGFGHKALATPGVEDAVFLKQLEQLVEQTKNMHKQLKEAAQIKREAVNTVSGINKQIDELKETEKLLGKGHYQYGTKYDSPLFKKSRYAGKNFDDFLNAYKGNSSALGKISKRLSQDFGMKDSSRVFTKNASKSQMKLYDEMAKSALAAGAQSELSYGSVNDIQKMLDSLQADIDKADSQKALLELIARVEIENARISAMRIKSDAANLKINSLNTQQTATEAQWAADFLKWK